MLGKAAALRPPRNRENYRRGMVPAPTCAVAPAPFRDNNKQDDRLVLRSTGFFEKDGRKIQVGDCALFQAGHAPPFIGIIRWISACTDGHLKLGVNWLYRPADVKLAKGSLLEAAPNEVFYSFHRDETPAASLLHPCKVTFLRKGVELPPGLPSFVCRRVYDIENKCLWWLSDQDYINERQDEVNLLLDKTQLEMHALQSGGCSPKNLSNPPSSQQLKPGPDSGQNCGTSIPVQVKGKKRERGDKGMESIKRDCSSKDDVCDSSRLEMIKAEIAKITEKGGLTNVEGVEQLINLMQLDRPDSKLDFASKVLLADIITATDRLDCLGRFVQLRGVPVLDDWLQDVHKGKSGNCGSPGEVDKSMEELLVALLRALDKLPVNLNALKTCNIGKSVNHLRSHKNPDIQKKARSLVDTWKKRVDAEMAKIDDAKSIGSYQATSSPSKSGFSDVSHGGSRRPSSADAMLKSSMVQSSTCKAAVAGKPGTSDSNTKVLPVTPGALKVQSSLPFPLAVSLKDLSGRPLGGAGTSDLPMLPAKEEKINKTGHYQNNCQSSSSDHGKVISPSLREDAKNHASGSTNSSKMAGSSSRHRRSSNGFVAATTAPGLQREASIGKPNSINRTLVGDKVLQSGSTCERTVDIPSADHSNSHRLTVRLPNPGCSPGRSGNGGSSDDPSLLGLKASSPGDAGKDDQDDHKIKVKTEVSRFGDVNTEPLQGNDMKEGLAAPDEVERSQGASQCEESCRTPDEAGKTRESSEVTCASSGNEKEVVLEETRMRNSLSSISALIEGRSTDSEACPPLSVGDDTGMNLLASVASGEMSNLASLAESPVFPPGPDDSCEDNNRGHSRSAPDAALPQNQSHTAESSGDESVKDGDRSISAVNKDGLQAICNRSQSDQNSMVKEDKLAGEQTEQLPCLATSFQNTVLQCVKSLGKIDDCVMSPAPSSETKLGTEGQATHPLKSRQKEREYGGDLGTDCKQQEADLLSNDKKKIGCVKEEGGNASGTKHEMVSCDKVAKKSSATDIGSNAVSPSEEHKGAVGVDAKTSVRSGDAVACSDVDNAMHLDNTNSVNTEKPESPMISSHSGTSDSDNKGAKLVTRTVDNLGNGLEDASKLRRGFTQISLVAASCEEAVTPSNYVSKDPEKTFYATEEKMSLTSGISPEVGPAVPDGASKLVIDLNEGFPGDDNQGEHVISAAQMHSHPIPLPQLAASQLSGELPVPITVAAPAKGPFVPPENLLRNKSEPGWKGSAATSAFRPAEPRRLLEMPLNASDAVPSSDATPAKQVRPALDIDLNVSDDRVFEDNTVQSYPHTVGSEPGAIIESNLSVKLAGGLDLDLNRVDESTDNSQFLANNTHRVEVPLIAMRPLSGGLPDVDSSMARGFDLNGPGFDEVGIEHAIRSQQAKTNGVPLQSSFACIRMNDAEVGSMTSWFPPRNSYPTVAIPSFLPDRGEQTYSFIPAAGSQIVLGPTATDIYRSPVLSSSPAMAFSHTTALPYAGYSFSSAFPLASSSFSGSTSYVDSLTGGPCFATVPSQLVGSAGAVSSPFVRSCVISLPEGSASGGSENTRKTDRQGLDLNAGPGSADVESERLASTMRQLPVAASQSFADERARIYQVIGAGLKRKEPDGGWDTERFAYKQPSWQ